VKGEGGKKRREDSKSKIKEVRSQSKSTLMTSKKKRPVALEGRTVGHEEALEGSGKREGKKNASSFQGGGQLQCSIGGKNEGKGKNEKEQWKLKGRNVKVGDQSGQVSKRENRPEGVTAVDRNQRLRNSKKGEKTKASTVVSTNLWGAKKR